MPIIRMSFSGLDSLTEIRPFEDGERVRFVVTFDVKGLYRNGKFTADENGNKHSIVFIADDGRTFLFSRLWSKRGGLTIDDAPEDVKDRAAQLPLNKGQKIRQYLTKCKVKGEFTDDSILTATIRLEHVEAAKEETGYKDWAWLEEPALSKVSPISKPTDDQISKVKGWAKSVTENNSNIALTIADDEIGWFVAALGY